MDYIKEIKNKHGSSYRVKFPYRYKGERRYFSKSVNINDYPNKKAALESAKSILAKARADVERLQKRELRVTLEDVFELKKKNYPKAIATVKAEKYMLGKYVYPHIDKDRLFSSIKPSEIQHTINEMAKTQLDTKVKRLYVLWRKLYQTAIIEEIVEYSPMDRIVVTKSNVVKNPKEQKTTKEDLDKVVNYLLIPKESDEVTFNDRIIAYALMTMYYLGLRPAETYALSKDCVDLKGNIVIINKSIGSTVDETTAVKPTKTKRSVRTLPIPRGLKPYLEELMDREFLFFDYHNQPFTFHKPPRRIEFACKKTGAKFHSYALRHLFITDLWESQADKNTIQNAVGHANESMSLYYGNKDVEKVAEAVEKIR